MSSSANDSSSNRMTNYKVARLIVHCTTADVILMEFHTLDPDGMQFEIRSLCFGYSKEHAALRAIHMTNCEKMESVQAAIGKALGITTIRSTPNN